VWKNPLGCHQQVFSNVYLPLYQSTDNKTMLLVHGHQQHSFVIGSHGTSSIVLSWHNMDRWAKQSDDEISALLSGNVISSFG